MKSKEKLAPETERLLKAILDKMPDLNKCYRKVFLSTLFLFLGLKDRINFSQLGRYGEFIDKTYRTHFKKVFDFLKFNKEVVKYMNFKELILVFDLCFLKKSGYKT